MMDNETGRARHVQNVEVLTPEEYRSGRRENSRPTDANRNFGQGYGNLWTYSSTAGCAPAVVSIVIFLVLLAEYGLLAAIGFAVFHLVGSAIGLYVQARKLINGQSFNPWLWRTVDWLVCIFLTIWLAS